MIGAIGKKKKSEVTEGAHCRQESLPRRRVRVAGLKKMESRLRFHFLLCRRFPNGRGSLPSSGETAHFTRLSVQTIYAASAAGENAIAKGDSQPAALPQEHQEKEERESTGGRKEKQQLEADRN